MLPDNRSMLDAYARYLAVSSSDPLELLSAIGADCPGAITFGDPHAHGRIEPIVDTDMEASVAGLRHDRVEFYCPDFDTIRPFVLSIR